MKSEWNWIERIYLWSTLNSVILLGGNISTCLKAEPLLEDSREVGLEVESDKTKYKFMCLDQEGRTML
jgi:hypothetical protein